MGISSYNCYTRACNYLQRMLTLSLWRNTSENKRELPLNITAHSDSLSLRLCSRMQNVQLGTLRKRGLKKWREPRGREQGLWKSYTINSHRQGSYRLMLYTYNTLSGDKRQSTPSRKTFCERPACGLKKNMVEAATWKQCSQCIYDALWTKAVNHTYMYGFVHRACAFIFVHVQERNCSSLG